MIISAANSSPAAKFNATLRSAAVLAGRDLKSRYARSILGPLWLFLTPIALVGVYYVVFGIGLGVKWPDPRGGTVGFIVPFMAGLTVYQYLSEVITSSLSLFYTKRNYVKKSTFSLFALWLSNFLKSGFLGGVNLAILIGLLVWARLLSGQGILFSLPVIAAVLLIAAALSIMLSVLGAFIGDLANGAAVVLRILFYSAPVTYPLEVLPAPWNELVQLNPLTAMIGLLRQTLVFGLPPDIVPLVVLAACGAAGIAICAVIFKRASGALPDVV